MPKATSREKQEKVLEAIRAGEPLSEIARRFGITPKTVGRIRDRAIEARQQSAEPSRHQTRIRARIAFSRVAAYFCRPCNRMVRVRPCPACAARAGGKKRRSRCFRDPAPGAQPAPSKPAELVDLLPPAAVLEWLEQEIQGRIGMIGNRDEAAEAAQDLAAQLHRLCLDLAVGIAADRQTLQAVRSPLRRHFPPEGA